MLDNGICAYSTCDPAFNVCFAVTLHIYGYSGCRIWAPECIEVLIIIAILGNWEAQVFPRFRFHFYFIFYNYEVRLVYA